MQVYSAPLWMMARDPQAILLDCGCGSGQFTRMLAELLGTSRMLGIELDSSFACQAQQHGVRALLADLNRPLPVADSSIDVIAAFNVLEHLVETEVFIQEIYRLLAPGGYALIDTPNLASWHNIAALLAGLQPFSGPNITSMTESDVSVIRRMHRRAHGMAEDGDGYRLAGSERHRHLVVVAYRSLVKALQRGGFVIEQARGYGYYPFPPLLSRWLSRIDPWHSHHMLIKARKPKA